MRYMEKNGENGEKWRKWRKIIKRLTPNKLYSL